VAVAERGTSAVAPPLARREAWRRRTLSMPWQALIVASAFVELIVAVVNADTKPTGYHPRQRHVGVQTMTTLALLVFCADLAVRLYVYRPKLFFKSGWNCIDFVLVLISILVAIAELAAYSAAPNVTLGLLSITRGFLASRVVFHALRAARVARAARLLFRAGRGSQQAARHLTGENKKRYVDLADGFDLDLTYVTPRLVAMSVPSTGIVSLFRNPLTEVVRLFELRHPHGYSVANCCPELPYDGARFTSGVVECYDIQDHTPPTMAQFVHFLNSSGPRAAADVEHVLAVHCRGGKGRTGSMVCAWLLYSRECETADDALALFALARTELGIGSRRLQGVDTPSQRRYVSQLAAMLMHQGAFLDTPAADVRAGAAGRAGGTVRHPSQGTRLHQAGSGGRLSKEKEKPLRERRLPHPRAVQLPPFTRLGLRSLTVHTWWRTLPKSPLVCALHVMSADRPGGTVVFWSKPVIVELAPPDLISNASRSPASVATRGGAAGIAPASHASESAARARDDLLYGAEEGNAGLGSLRTRAADGSRPRVVVHAVGRAVGDAVAVGGAAMGGAAAGASKLAGRATQAVRSKAKKSAKHLPVTFELEGMHLRGDVRVSVFALDPLLRESERLLKKGLSARQPWDCASRPVWHGQAGRTSLVGSISAGSLHTRAGSNREEPVAADAALRDLKRMPTGERAESARVIAGTETGCLFFFQLHTGFAPQGVMSIPVTQMDRAFKKVPSKYDEDGFASLRYVHIDPLDADGQKTVRRAETARSASPVLWSPPDKNGNDNGSDHTGVQTNDIELTGLGGNDGNNGSNNGNGSSNPPSVAQPFDAEAGSERVSSVTDEVAAELGWGRAVPEVNGWGPASGRGHARAATFDLSGLGVSSLAPIPASSSGGQQAQAQALYLSGGAVATEIEQTGPPQVRHCRSSSELSGQSLVQARLDATPSNTLLVHTPQVLPHLSNANSPQVPER